MNPKLTIPEFRRMVEAIGNALRNGSSRTTINGNKLYICSEDFKMDAKLKREIVNNSEEVK